MTFIGFIFLLIAVVIFTGRFFFSEDEDNLKFFPKRVGSIAAGFSVFFFTFGSVWFYAEPGYIYHVRTILGQEKVVSDIGWNVHLFGRINSWKRAMTVQTHMQTRDDGTMQVEAETENSSASVNLPALRITFLDQVDALVEATARFVLPTDKDKFLEMAHEYRTPENLLRTALVPAFLETLNANAGIISAEEVYSGARTQFNTEFENQMRDGIYFVRRIERKVADETAAAEGSANVSKGEQQDRFGDASKVVFEVEKILGQDGQPKRKPQSFTHYGIGVVDSRITKLQPNAAFLKRMELRQQASADRSIAKEQRVQEEEQRLLAIAKADRQVAEQQGAARVVQAKATTDAETKKQLAITEAKQRKEQAEIDREASVILLEKAEVDAKARKVSADAAAYEKKAVILADDALEQKLKAEVRIQELWAQAYANRKVPQYVFGGGDTPVGSDDEASMFMKMLTLQAAKALSYDRQMEK